ncbi:MAG TPA: hypothetical protein VFC91_02855 [Atribacterota bacterium]|nr:hypothetical protein [Atribacterota bacterium]
MKSKRREEKSKPKVPGTFGLLLVVCRGRHCVCPLFIRKGREGTFDSS